MKKSFIALNDALNHIKEVQKNITDLNHKSMNALNDVIFELDIDLPEDSFIALQHQDILSQQLSATNDLIDVITNHLSMEDNQLEEGILAALEVARDKKVAFSGNAFETQYEYI